MSAAPPVYSVIFLTHASTAYVIGARQLWQGRARGGHARGMTLSPCAAPMQPRTTV